MRVTRHWLVVGSTWITSIEALPIGRATSSLFSGKITHVQDVADALALSVGDDAVAGHFFNLVDGYMYWQVAAEIAKELCGSDATIQDRKGSGPRNQFDTRKAVAFFDRHGEGQSLRRGQSGVRAYVGELLRCLDAR